MSKKLLGLKPFRILFVCPVFNEGQRLRKLVESLKSQTSKEFDCIFVDSGSTDDTNFVVSDLTASSFKSFRFPDNLGIADNWARALDLALQEFDSSHVMFLGGDDSISPNFVEDLTSVLRSRELVNLNLIPQFLEINAAGHERFAIDPNLNLSRYNLLTNWSIAHLCYSLVSRNFAKGKYLPLLRGGSTNFDWWAAYELLGEPFELVSSAVYRKNVKGQNYESDYYFGDKAFRHRLLSRRPLLLAPAGEALALLETGAFPLGLMSKLKRSVFPIVLILARYVEAARNIQRRLVFSKGLNSRK